LTLDGYKVPVQVKTVQEKSGFTINLYSHDELFDYEKYVVGDNSFSLAEGALEVYSPPIPLLTFPFHFKEPSEPSREWNGTLSTELQPHSAHASIDVTKDDVVWNGSTTQSFHVTVVIFLEDSDPASQAKRTLEFWFSPGKGLLKRNFDNASVREPASD